jgi:hypothetical protein
MFWPPVRHPHVLFNSYPSVGAPDHWLNILLGAAAAFTVLGLLAAGYAGLRYGRRASLSLTADAHVLDDGSVIISCRPAVRAVGIRRVRFREGDGSVAKVVELKRNEASGGIADVLAHWEQPAIFGASFVEPGEEVPTTVVFPVGVPEDGVIGWRVSVNVRAPNRSIDPAASWAWADRVFVPRPAKVGGRIAHNQGSINDTGRESDAGTSSDPAPD